MKIGQKNDPKDKGKMASGLRGLVPPSHLRPAQGGKGTALVCKFVNFEVSNTME